MSKVVPFKAKCQSCGKLNVRYSLLDCECGRARDRAFRHEIKTNPEFHDHIVKAALKFWHKPSPADQTS